MFNPDAFVRRRARFSALGRVTCPCCGYPTIPERATLKICSLCSWEDDGQDDAVFRPAGAPAHDPGDVVGGANHDYSLTEARENFARHRTSFRPGDMDYVIARGDRGTRRLRREIIAAYDRAVDGLTGLERAEEDVHYFFNRMYGI